MLRKETAFRSDRRQRRSGNHDGFSLLTLYQKKGMPFCQKRWKNSRRNRNCQYLTQACLTFLIRHHSQERSTRERNP